MSPTSIILNNRKIGTGCPTYFIADIAANHDGDLSRAVDLIHLAAEAGADAAKFQHFQAKTIVSDKGFRELSELRSHQSKWEKSVYEVYEDASVDLNWTEVLKRTCKDAGITFITTPYSLEVIDELDSHLPAYKIGSGDITWRQMVEKVASMSKPYFLACGASNFQEVEDALEWCLPINRDLVLMQCNTNYTASLENFKYINLNVLKKFQSTFPDVLLGLSDHTPGHATVLGAVSLGAVMVEKHFTDANDRVGPDHEFSMNPDSWREMVDRTRELELSFGDGEKRVEENELETVVVQRRSLRAKRALVAGHRIKDGDFEVLRPCPVDALPPSFIEEIYDKVILKDMSAGDYLKRENVQF